MKQEEAKKIFKSNFIGPAELQKINRFKVKVPKNTGDINLNVDNIDSEKYILIYGCKSLENLSTLDISTFIKKFGFKYSPNEVCFYNQDWYLEEEFAKLQARLNALKCKSSSNIVKVSSKNLKGYNPSSKKTKGRSTTLNQIKKMTKKASKAFRFRK